MAKMNLFEDRDSINNGPICTQYVHTRTTKKSPFNYPLKYFFLILP